MARRIHRVGEDNEAAMSTAMNKKVFDYELD